ncbi:MAG: HEPN domain-containing protein [Deltaproteobacteria bacterium]|nr:MAG: HEPN domain-containing protein [Deltaproteobacteria bacterium]
MSDELIHVVREWVEKAEHDLKNAEHTLTLGDDCPFDTVCFHAQQCAEKYLKALLTYLEINFPRTHDLTELFILIPDVIFPDITIDGLAELSPYAVESRYPGEWEPLTRQEANRAVEVAKKIKTTARNTLKNIRLTKSE